MITRSTSCQPLRAIAFAVVAAMASLSASLAQAAQRSDSTAVRPAQDNGYALVQLLGDPLATDAKTRPAKGRKIDFNNSTNTAYRAKLSALRNDYNAWLHVNVPQARVSGEFDISLNAVAVRLDGATLAQVAAATMVRNAQLHHG